MSRSECSHRYYLKYKERLLKKSKDQEKAIKLEALRHYSKSETPYCQCCKEQTIEFLSLDHIGEWGAEHRRKDPTVMKLARWVRRNGFPEGFRVLCMNCNFAFGKFGYCPHGL